MLSKALRDRSDVQGVMQCEREENFTEMFNALENPQAQDRIRRLHRQRAHCSLLRENPNACMELHRDFGDMPAGSMCPNNPMVEHAELVEAAQENAWLVDRAHLLSRLKPSEDSSPIDVTMAAMYQEWRAAQLSGLWPKPSDS